MSCETHRRKALKAIASMHGKGASDLEKVFNAPSSNIEERARLFAIERHAGQLYGELPYSVHLEEVAESFDPRTLGRRRALAWLHDVVEDNHSTLDEIRALFDDEMARDVETLSHRKGQETYTQYIERIRSQGSPNARAVKIADLKANIKRCVGDDSKKSLATRYEKALNVLRRKNS